MSLQTIAMTGRVLQGSEKLKDVENLLQKLNEDLERTSLLPQQRDAAFEQLKIYGRDPLNADPIFTKDGIEILARHAFKNAPSTTSRNALRCLANAMLLKPATRQIFLNLHYGPVACDWLKHESWDDEFLLSRILFLTTYGTNVNMETLIDQHRLAENIIQNLGKHVLRFDDKNKLKLPIDSMEEMALVETLKLMFNVSHFCPQRSKSFTPAVPHILTILTNHQIIQSKPLEVPFGPLINSLINLDLKEEEAMNALFPRTDPLFSTARFLDLLELAVKSYKEEELDLQLAPLITLLRKVYEIASEDVRGIMINVLLPSDNDREQPLGRTETLSSRLLRLSTSAIAPQSRDGISSLLFELSDKDAGKFVRNIGYGFASGFLFQHNIPILESALNASGTDDDEEALTPSLRKMQINPITGQAVDFETKPEGPEMTKEEKEREAERLMVLFERLKKNGIITTENPLAKAQREGMFEDSRFQELDSDEDDS